MLWQRNMHSSFPGSFTSAGEILTGTTLPPKRSRKNKIKGSEQSYSQSLHRDPSSNAGMKQLLDIPNQTTFIVHSKARKFFLLLHPHHYINPAVIHEQWATYQEFNQESLFLQERERGKTPCSSSRSDHFFF